MKTTIKSIRMENFKGVRNPKEIPLGEKTEIRGRNASGKTTVLDSLWWLLFNKDSLGNEKFSIRPLDSCGKQIDNVDITVSAVLDIDGDEMELKKVQKQNWVKKRGTGEMQLQGNVNSYEIDGYPKTEKEYKARISEIAEEDLFKILTNPVYFPSMKWQEQRAILMRFISEISDVELAEKDSRFADFLDELKKAPSTDDIKKKYQKSLTEWKKQQTEFPVRIDEVAKQKVDIDVAELELQRNALNEQIAEVKAKESGVEKQVEEYQKLSDGIMELKFAESDLQRKANEENSRKRRDIEDSIYGFNGAIEKCKKEIEVGKHEISKAEDNIKYYETELNTARELWKSNNVMQFDESEKICQMCGQKLPQDKIDVLLRKFDERKEKVLSDITERGNRLKNSLDTEKDRVEKLKESVSENEKVKAKLENRIVNLEKQLRELPQSIDISDTEECKAIQSQIAEKEQTMREMNSADEIRKSIRAELDDLLLQLSEAGKQIAKSQKNIEIDERIAELQKEQREVAQKVADQEKMLYLLEEFIRYKMNVVSDTINSKLSGINVKLFENQINGGMKECCEITYNGVPYGSLNSGHRIVAGLLIIKALQELYGIYLPVFVDNSETVNSENFPKMDCQIIKMIVTDDVELKVEVQE